MRRRLSLNGVIVASAAASALILSFTRPSPEGLVAFGVGEREVRAAPGAPSASADDPHNLTALKVFNRTLVRIRDSYVDAGRIDPKQMLYNALDSVQFNIPEVLVEKRESEGEVIVQVGATKQRFSTADVDSPWRLSGKLKKIFRFIEANLTQSADLAQVEYAAVNGMLSTLDPHSVLLDPEMAREMDVNTSGKFGGLGIVIAMRDRKLTVVRPMKGTPAFRAGIEAGDHIARIDQEVTENLTLQEAVDRMRGDPGTSVTVWVERDGHDELLRFEITRAQIKVPSVESKMLTGRVGYLKVEQFAGRTAKEVRQHIEDLEGQGARAWVVDLRWNPGGLLEQAIMVADLFVDQGTLVTTIGGREREPRRATRKATVTDAPVAVLVNGNSASASEIVAGALKNLNRAIVLGSTTFGKGSVQILYDNEDGSKLKLTIAEYLTPGDRSIQSLGIVPDIALQRMFVPKNNEGPTHQVRLLPPTQRYREVDLKAHLDSEYAAPAAKPDATFRYVYEKPDDADAGVVPDDGDGAAPLEVREPVSRDGLVVDFPVELARDLVARASDEEADAILERASQLLDRRRSGQQKQLSGALDKLGIDWSAPPAAAANDAQLSGSFGIEAPGGDIDAGEEIELVGTVTNTGNAPAYQVHARVEDADYGLFQDVELVFGRVDPGQSRTWTSHLKVPEDAHNRIDVLEFDLREARGATAKAAPLKVRIEAAERPVYAYSHQLIDEGNRDGLVQRGERHRLRVTIRNTGKGKARSTTALLRNASGDGVIVKKGRFEIGELAPGESKTVEFLFDVTDALQASELVAEMTVYDRVLRESVGEKLRYPLASASSGPSKASGWIHITRDGTPIYEGADANAGRVASADRGASFRVTGSSDRWYRIRLGDDRPGFVRTSGVERAPSGKRSADLETHWQVTPPSLQVSQPTYETGGETYRLQATATDDTRVEDLYVFVSNEDAKIENKKVLYRSNRSGAAPKQLALDAEIPLWPGTNKITLVARENGDVKATHTMFLYRHTSRATAAATPRITQQNQ